MSEVVIVKTGIANLASVQAGLRRVGADTIVTADPAAIRDAGHVMLPGVGAFGAAMEVLRNGAGDALRDRIAANRPTLAICLGMQLLCRESEESPGVAGLGILEAAVTRYPDTVTVPQMGWARITADPAAQLLRSGYVYFANSYRVARVPEGWRGATGDYAGPYAAAVERGKVLACQFHPELSGKYGKHLLRSWIELEAD